MRNMKYSKLTGMIIAVCLLTGCGQNASTVPEPAAEQETIVEEGQTVSETAESSQSMPEEKPDAGNANDIAEDDGTPGTEQDGTEEMKDTVNGAFQMSDGIILPELKLNDLSIPQGTAFEYVNDCGVGFNLGNTFDAYNDGSFSDEMSIETFWQKDQTSEELIHALHEFGFDTIRIPVSWHNHVDDSYNISEPWLDRVNEVVDWAIAEDMHVIINIHHDNHPEADCFYPDRAHMDQSKKYISRIWEQLSERFRDYDDRLIFEAMNEPRLVGHENEWWIDPRNEDCIESIECINELDQLFVDTVRASGGNNTSRYLMVPGYDASIDGALHSSFVFPSDPADATGDRANGHILLSIHGYTPYSFALEYPGIDIFDLSSADSTRDLDSYMNKLYTTFIRNNIPVMIGEYGSRDKNGNLQARVNFTAYYVRLARARGMSCSLWDNNAWSGDGEIFGVVNRSEPQESNFDILSAIMTYK